MSGTPPLSDAVMRHLLRVASEPDLTGTRYELGELIGRGAMGVVYSVRDTQLDRKVAMKVLHSDGPIGDDVISRTMDLLTRRARAAAR